MFKVCIVLFLFASVYSESVRETETWMPMRTTQTVAMSSQDNMESSGDFGFSPDDEDDDDDGDDDDYNYGDDDEEFSGSGDGATIAPTKKEPTKTEEPDINDNRIQEEGRTVRPTINVVDVQDNEIPLLSNEPQPGEDQPGNVLMAHTSDESIFNKTEVLAALIAGSAVGLMFAVLLILLLVYRMKKKDEGSYDLGKKPIYKKAPTTEIYA